MEYAKIMNSSVYSFSADDALQLLEEEGIETEYWIEQIEHFWTAAQEWQDRSEKEAW